MSNIEVPKRSTQDLFLKTSEKFFSSKFIAKKDRTRSIREHRFISFVKIELTVSLNEPFVTFFLDEKSNQKNQDSKEI